MAKNRGVSSETGFKPPETKRYVISIVRIIISNKGLAIRKLKHQPSPASKQITLFNGCQGKLQMPLFSTPKKGGVLQMFS